MNSVEFEKFRAHTISEYAAVHVSVGNWTKEESHERSTQAIETLLPRGVETESALVLTAENEEGAPIGYLWIALQRDSNPQSGAWIYDIELYEQFRGKGYGRELLRVAEEEVKRHGVSKLGLNVFGNNAIARNLYETSGFSITTIQMSKEL
jgi:ribosomal protein S18 acetylase RimI-like enzyme